MNKNFKVLSIKKRENVSNNRDVISYVTYLVEAEKENTTVFYQGMVGLPLPAGDFTEFSDVTEEQVISWIRATIDEQRLDSLLEKLIIKQKYGEPIEAELPWNN